MTAADFPTAEISKKGTQVKFYLPDAHTGYYRATRFDWSGQIYSLKAGGHEYFGQWFERYDPNLHDSIQGPVEEFVTTGDGSIGYQEAAVGDAFVRIGVGAVRKPDDKPYGRFKTYEVVDPGQWTIRPGSDAIEFIHELKDVSGYAYRYSKKVRLTGDGKTMVIEHALKNTGKKPLTTMQYNHNFFTIDGQPTGPDSSVLLGFDPQPTEPFNPELAEVQKNRIVYKKELTPGLSAATQLIGPTTKASDYDFRVENRKAGAGVHVSGSLPFTKVYYWSIRSTTCPEAYVDVSTEPGKTTKWKYTYNFYEIK